MKRFSKGEQVRTGLSGRERECLHWLAAGESDASIGARLSISPRTVRFHVERAKGVLKAKNRVHMIALALRANLLD
jgi:DNA-binding CsgD family transcriptional regulator